MIFLKQKSSLQPFTALFLVIQNYFEIDQMITYIDIVCFVF